MDDKKITAATMTAIMVISMFSGIIPAMAQTSASATPSDGPKTNVVPGEAYEAN